jgi:mannose-6-phosphate isomerase-like protein (cupin superfamily)
MALKPALLLSLFVLCFALALSTQDREQKRIEECQHQCKHLERSTGRERVQCMKTCEEYITKKKEDLEEDELVTNKRKWEPRTEEDRRCRALCKEEQSERAQRHCEDECRGGRRRTRWEENSHKKEVNNPYVFGDEDFTTTLETEQGRISRLRKFTDQSDLLRGVENFRLVVLEADPQTFVVPAHFDADVLLYVAKGRGSITTVRNKKQSFNLRRGDIFRIPAGTPAYMTNSDETEELFIVKLLQPVSLPGHFEAFHGTGGENPESFYTAFSWDVLEAAFNTERQNLKRVFGQSQEGGIVKATKKQIRALGPSSLQPGIWPFGSDPSGPFNLLKQQPTKSNTFGKLFEAKSEDYNPLRDLDVMVAFANITRGGMVAPYYNSRATKISFVVEGEGWLEMACPHVSSGKESQGERFFENIRAPLRKGTVFVAPAGHPIVTIASETKNLQLLCFEVNAKGNIRFPLAGRNNIIDKMDREAKELSFNLPADDVDRVFQSQNEDFFFPGPKRGHQSEHSSM